MSLTLIVIAFANERPPASLVRQRMLLEDLVSKSGDALILS